MDLIDGITIAAAVFVVLAATAAFLGVGPRQARQLLPALAGVLGVVVVLQVVAIPFAATASTTPSGPTTSPATVSATHETSTPPAPTTEASPTVQATDSPKAATVETFLATSEPHLPNPPTAPACGGPTKWTFHLAKAYKNVKAKVSIEGGQSDPKDKVRIEATRLPLDGSPPKLLTVGTGAPIALPVDGADQLVLTMTPSSNCNGKVVVWTFTV